MRSKSSSPSCTPQAGAPPYRPDATGAPPYRPDATGAPPYRPDATGAPPYRPDARAPGAGADGTRRLSCPQTPARAAARQRPRVPPARLTPAAPCGAGLLVRRTIKGTAPPGGFARSWEVHEITPQGRAQLAARKARASRAFENEVLFFITVSSVTATVLSVTATALSATGAASDDPRAGFVAPRGGGGGQAPLRAVRYFTNAPLLAFHPTRPPTRAPGAPANLDPIEAAAYL